jgi:hypothetical protein
LAGVIADSRSGIRWSPKRPMMSDRLTLAVRILPFSSAYRSVKELRWRSSTLPKTLLPSQRTRYQAPSS